MAKVRLLLGALLTAAVVTPALAHTAWLEPAGDRPGHYRLLFGGHQGKLESYDPAKLKTVDALDVRGRKLAVTQTVGTDGLRLRIDGRPALVALHFDNGVHARTTAGGPSVPKPMNEVSGAVSAVRALKYGKTVVDWSPLVTRPLGQAFEVTPLDAGAPVAGRPMRVRITLDGRPAEGVRVGHGEEGEAGQTDADGVASFIPVKGANKLWAGRRLAVMDSPQYTQLSYEYLMTFNAR
jgi:nickel transport protein